MLPTVSLQNGPKWWTDESAKFGCTPHTELPDYFLHHLGPSARKGANTQVGALSYGTEGRAKGIDARKLHNRTRFLGGRGAAANQ